MPLAASVAGWSLWEKTVATSNPAAIGGQRGSRTSAAHLRRSVAGELVDSASPLVLAVAADCVDVPLGAQHGAALEVSAQAPI